MSVQVNNNDTNNFNHIETIDHPQVVKKINTKIIALAVALLIAGILAIAGYVTMTGTTALSLLFIGAALIITGFILAFTKSKHRVYQSTNSVIKTQKYHFEKEQLKHIENLLSQGSFTNTKPLNFTSSSNAYLNVLSSNDKHFAAVQLFEFIPFDYKPASPIYYFNDMQALDFSSYIGICNVEK